MPTPPKLHTKTIKAQKKDLERRLAVAIVGIGIRMPTCHGTTVYQCLGILPRWSEGRHLMPGDFPFADRLPARTRPPVSMLRRFIVLYEVKLAVARYWDLMNTEKTVGLTQLIARLERYAAKGWDDGRVVGTVETGYGLEFPEDQE